MNPQQTGKGFRYLQYNDRMLSNNECHIINLHKMSCAQKKKNNVFLKI